jgi:hypothetical protein
MSGPTYISIEERTDLTKSVFDEIYLSAQKPVIVRGGIAHWRSVRSWSPEWFARTYPNVKVPIAIGPRRQIARVEHMEMRDFVAAMTISKEHMYLRQFDLFRLLPELLYGTPDPHLAPGDRQLVRNFWMGANTLQPLHYDAHWRIMGTCNLFAQIHGTKKVILASPQQSPYLYERRGEQSDYHLSQVDIEAPDLRRFPLLRKATLWTGEIHGGDLLFVPLNYWHFLQSLGASISVSFWWHPHTISHLAYRLLSLAEDPRLALQFARQHEGVVTRKDVEEVGGIQDLREGLQAVPSQLRDIVTLLFDKDVRAAVSAPVSRWFEK